MSIVNNQPPVGPTTQSGSGIPSPVGGSDNTVANLLNAVLQQTNLTSILQGTSHTPQSRSIIVQDALTSTSNTNTETSITTEHQNRSISNPNLKSPTETGKPPEISGGNPWLKPSALSAFLMVMFEVASIMSKMKLQDMKNEIREIQFRQNSVEASAKNIIDQAELEMIKAICQAVVSFVSAGLAIGMAIGSAGTGKRAEEAVAKDAKALKTNEKCNGNKGVEDWLNKKAELNTKQEKLDKMVVGKPMEEGGQPVTKKEYTQLKKEVSELKEFVDTHKPGFQQFQSYQNDNFSVKTSEEGISQPLPKSIDDKNKSLPKDEISFKEETKVPSSKKDIDEVNKDIKNKDTPQDEKKITVTKDEKEQAQFNKDEKYAKESSEEGMKIKKRYDELNDPSSQTYQSAISNKMQQYNMMFQALNTANQAISQALNGLIGAGFELQVAGLKSDAVYIQGTMDGAQKVIDSFEDNRKNTMQNLNDLLSNLLNYIQTYWAGVGSFKQS